MCVDSVNNHVATAAAKSSHAGVQPRLIQGIRRRDGVGEGQETAA